jgi:hypothetical protein
MLKEDKKRLMQEFKFLQKYNEMMLDVNHSDDEAERDTEIDGMMNLA